MSKRKNTRKPQRFGRQVNPGETPRDPSRNLKDAPPNFSRDLIPQIITFSGRTSSMAQSYRNPDQAIRESLENARFMRNDTSIMECLEARQRGTALLNWHIEPEDQDDPEQKKLADDVSDIIKRTPQFTEYRRNLLEALWYGRYACQHKFGFDQIKGERRIVIQGWRPIHGDKLVFRWDDGSGKYKDGQIGIRVGTMGKAGDVIAGNRKVEYTDQGPAYFIDDWERSLIAVHKHIIEDGAYEDPLSAGRIHGVGIRDRIYWCWFQKQETMAMLMEVIERTGTGFTIYYYPAGNPQAKQEVREMAEAQTRTNIILMPRMPGDPTMDAYGLDRIEPNTGGIDALKSIIHEFFGHQIKRYILGQILSSESAATGLGSGVADLHMDTFSGITQYDSVKLEETLTTEVVEPLKNYNFPRHRDTKLFMRIDTKDANAESRLQSFKTAWDMGAKLRAQDVMDTIGAAMPREGDEVLQNPQMAGGGEGAGDAPGAGDVPGDDQPMSLQDLFGDAASDGGEDDPGSEQQEEQPTPERYAKIDEVRVADELLRRKLGQIKGARKLTPLGTVKDFFLHALWSSKTMNAAVRFDPSVKGRSVYQDGRYVVVGNLAMQQLNQSRDLGTAFYAAAEQLNKILSDGGN